VPSAALQQDARPKGVPKKSVSGTRRAGFPMPDVLRYKYANPAEIRQLQVRRCTFSRRTPR